jgi:hypothetical protein
MDPLTIGGTAATIGLAAYLVRRWSRAPDRSGDSSSSDGVLFSSSTDDSSSSDSGSSSSGGSSGSGGSTD